ncbi:hypothetical protein [Bradyrhizobium tropiciagri]|uniref:hypothetical protein n=1 Tax=Bradyrhizobium tropiciagri TaxID=312253 RepID=UPI00067E3A73|nr:hypothetical protein [Bradyrhizobium tropiciagri]
MRGGTGKQLIDEPDLQRKYLSVILRSATSRVSKDARPGWWPIHPSRLAEEARTSSDNGKAVARG